MAPAKLIVIGGPDAGREFQLGDTQVLGRLPQNAIPLSDESCSRQHTRVHRSKNGYAVVDLNSRNGTLVNGAKADRADLRHGDTISLGSTTLRFETTDEPAQKVPKGGPTPGAQLVGGPEGAISFGDGGSGDRTVSDKALRTATSTVKRRGKTGSATAWLKIDVSQHAAIFRILVTIGVLLLTGGLGFLAFRVVAG